MAKIGAIDYRPSKNRFSFIKMYDSVAGTWQTGKSISFNHEMENLNTPHSPNGQKLKKKLFHFPLDSVFCTF